MLPRRHRLTSPADFRRVIRSGHKITRGTVIVHELISTHDPGSEPRLGVTVSKAVGGSVVRHRVSRVIRHTFADHLDSLPAGSLWVIRALPAAGQGIGAKHVADDVRAAMRQAVQR